MGFLNDVERAALTLPHQRKALASSTAGAFAASCQGMQDQMQGHKFPKGARDKIFGGVQSKRKTLLTPLCTTFPSDMVKH